MPTILLQEIRDLLTAFLTAINTKIEQMLVTLNAVKDDADAIKDNTDSIKQSSADIKTNTDVLPGMAQDLDEINYDVAQIDSKMDTANSTLTDIKNNTGAVVTPINVIKNNIVDIKSDADAMVSDLNDINAYMNTISTNTGRCASADEDTATNTHEMSERLQLISSDTTQMRADNQAIIAILNQIYDKL